MPRRAQRKNKSRQRGSQRGPRAQRQTVEANSMFDSTRRSEAAVLSTNRSVYDKYITWKIPLFPQKCIQRGMLYYDSNLTVTLPNSGLASHYVFCANGLFDPDITGTGHQPMGFDQMMLCYEQATVIRSQITVSILPAHQARVALLVSAVQNPSTTSGVLVENGQLVTKALQAPITFVGLEIPKLSIELDIAKFFGRKTSQELLDDVNLYTTNAANPTEQVYFSFCGWQAFAFSATDAITFDVVISYDAVFWEPRQLTQS
jgi:hypothetical protein